MFITSICMQCVGVLWVLRYPACLL